MQSEGLQGVVSRIDVQHPRLVQVLDYKVLEDDLLPLPSERDPHARDGVRAPRFDEPRFKCQGQGVPILRHTIATHAVEPRGEPRIRRRDRLRGPRAISAPRSAGSTLFRTTAPMLFAFCELKSRPTSNVNGAVPRVAYSQSSALPGLTWVARPSWSTWYPFASAISMAKLLSRSSSAVGNRVYDQG